MTGTTLGHYQILEQLGEGGMGVVYKARDTHLDRFVAVKVLPHEAVADADRKRRFIQEARAASALNHPNIVTIHDIAQQGDVDYMVMEFVDGKTLSALIGRKGMPLDEFLPVAIQAADGLARAHANGIIHRDIKPGNIMVTRDGKAKVLDFGLAKLTERSAGIGEDAVTRTQGRTEQGAILGTAAYMSPEQAQGKELDSRSDVFSFGAVLHEMLTGEPVFRRENGVSTLSAVLRDEPKTIGDNLPRELDRIIRQCLRKQPQRRFQHMDDVRVELENLKEEADSGRMTALPAPPAGALSVSRGRLALLLAPALVLAAAAGWYFARPSQQPTAAVRRPVLRRLTADSGLTTHPALSPDGKWVAYASDRESDGNLDIWVQQIATGERRKLTSDGADEHEPSFSPDSSRLAYRSEQDGGGIYVVSILGGEPKRVVRAGRRPRFSPDGARLAYWTGGFGSNGRLEGTVWVAPTSGGEAVRVRPEWSSAGFPEWSPDGRRLAAYLDLLEGDRPDSDWWITSVDSSQETPIRIGLTEALRKEKLRAMPDPVGAWIAHSQGGPEYLYFVARPSAEVGNIWRAPVSAATGKLSGAIEQLTFGTGSERYPSVASAAGGGVVLTFIASRRNADIWSLPIDTDRGLHRGEPVRITDQESDESAPGISGDGTRLVFTSNRAGPPSVWVRDLRAGQERQLAAVSNMSVISRDGRQIAYRKGPVSGNADMYIAGDGDARLLCRSCLMQTSFSTNGSLILAQGTTANIPIELIDAASGQRTPILADPKQFLTVGRFSPDTRWIVFTALPSATERQIYVAPFRGAQMIDRKEWIPITDGKGMERYADWSPDGNTLYFLSERDGFRCIRAQRLDKTTKQPVGPPIDIQHFHHARRSLLAMGDPVLVKLCAAVDKLVFALAETTGNIWMTEVQ